MLTGHLKHTIKGTIMSKWNIVYRKDANGIWRAVASFLIHADGEDYRDSKNLIEPNHYRTSIENRSI